MVDSRGFSLVQAGLLRILLHCLWSAVLLSQPALQASAQASHPWMDPTLAPDRRAELLLPELTLDEKISLVHGVNGAYAGNTPSIERLGIPALKLQDGPAGVAGGRTGVTALPAPISLAASWDVALMRQYGKTIAEEERGKGTNVQLAPMMNIARVPQAGRNFETFGEDPFLASAMAASAVLGIQSQGVIATTKHFVNNEQETDRDHSSSDLDERTQHEIYFPPFRAAINAGAGAVMASYNRVNGNWACQSEALNTVLKKLWGFQGFVMTDWWANFHAVAGAINGLDLEMPTGYRFGTWLKPALLSGEVPQIQLDEMVKRILTTMFRFGLFENPSTGTPDANVRSEEHDRFARDAAAQGIVLLRNNGVLPLPESSSVRTIAVIGSAAVVPISTGGGSAHVVMPYQINPLYGISNRAGSGISVYYRQGDGGHIADAASLARASDVAVIIAGEESTEGTDRSGLRLPGDQDELIGAVAEVNPRTVVVLNVSAPMVFPWIDKVAAALMVWFPGQENGNAVASVLFGDVNPSGKLPLTLPRFGEGVPIHSDEQFPGVRGHVSYSERLLTGYRWYDANSVSPLFPFGHGLSYTTFKYENLFLRPADVSQRVDAVFDLTNIGDRDGSEVAQLYLGFPSGAGEPPRQLKAFEKVRLSAGETRRISFSLTPDELSYWDSDQRAWIVPRGTFQVFIGASSRDIRLTGTFPITSEIPPAHPANSALGRSATASSFRDAGLEAEKVLDGDPQTFWRSQDGPDQWINFDLGIEKDLGRIRLLWGPEFARSYVIETSPDGKIWTKIYQAAAGEGGIDDLTGLKGRGRYVRITMNRGAVSSYSLASVEIYGPVQRSYGRWAHRLPGRIQLVDFDYGGEGIGFHHSGSVDASSYRPGTMNIQAAQDLSGGYSVGPLKAGDWLEYTVSVPDPAATYAVSVRAATGGEGGRLRLRLDGRVFGTAAVSGTGGNQNWQTFRLPDATLDGGGTRVLRLEILQGSVNLNWIDLIQKSVCGSDNIALGKPVATSSSESTALQGSNAVDGSPLSRWGSELGKDPQWITVDLGLIKDICRIKLDWETSFARTYQVQSSIDGISWSNLYSTDNGNGGVEELPLNGSARYLRVYGTQRGSIYGYSLWEIEINETLLQHPGRR